MPSTPWHSRRPARAALLLGILALAFSVPAAAAHVACEHAEEAAPEQHHCAVCRHLDDQTPVLTVLSAPSAPTLITVLAPVAPAVPTDTHLPPARGRSPPVDVPVS